MFNERNVIAILNGSSGVGKSTLAKKIVTVAESRGLTSIICSADDYFINYKSGEYIFDKNKLFSAHRKCLDKFDAAISVNINWIIVDNTNVDLKSIKPYYKPNSRYNHKIVRPNVDWYFNAEECFKKNTHNVPLETIKRMIDSIKKFSLEDVRADICWI